VGTAEGVILTPIYLLSAPVAARSKAWVQGRWLAGIAGSNPARGHGCLSVVIVVFCQVEVSSTGPIPRLEES
jgi:hypothetical protein